MSSLSKDAPLSLEHPVVGVRLWQALTPHNIPARTPMCARWMWTQYHPDRLYGLLQSAPRFREWKPGVNEAICATHHKHTSPQHDCTCGIHAYHSYDEVPRPFKKEGDTYVLGIVRGWGTCYCHAEGWRAEKAEILALFGDWGTSGRLPRIAEIYGVPLLTKQGLPAILSEFGTPVPKSMRPQSDERSSQNPPTP